MMDIPKAILVSGVSLFTLSTAHALSEIRLKKNINKAFNKIKKRDSWFFELRLEDELKADNLNTIKNLKPKSFAEAINQRIKARKLFKFYSKKMGQKR